MAKRNRSLSLIRLGAQRAEVYNEGLCVYVWDEGWSDRLRSMLDSRTFGEAHYGRTFYENLSDPAFGAAVAESGMAFCYCLQQDDEVVLEAVVGPALDENEQKAACWLPLQRTWIDLPTGRLRIDTANTMPIDPEDHEDEGAVLAFPPGFYAVLLYRVDWQEMERRSRKGYAGPQEFLVLTKLDEPPRPSSATPILEFPRRVDARDWVDAWSVDGQAFHCRIQSFGYWEGFHLNLDRKAVAAMHLQVGSVLALKFHRQWCDVVYLGDWSWEDYCQGVGNSQFDAAYAGRKEVAAANWRVVDGDEVLTCMRFRSTKAHPEKIQGVWIQAEGRVTTEVVAPTPLAAVEASLVSEGKIDAGVVFVDDGTLVLNVDRSSAAAIGAVEGSLMRLAIGGAVHSIHLGRYGEPWGRALLHNCDWVAEKFRMYLRLGTTSFIQEGSSATLPEGVEAIRLGSDERRPLTGAFSPSSLNPTAGMLHLQPMYVNGREAPFDWLSPPQIGDRCLLEAVSSIS